MHCTRLAYVDMDIKPSVKDILNSDSSVGLSINYWKNCDYIEEKSNVYRGYMFAVETSNENQNDTIDVYNYPAFICVDFFTFLIISKVKIVFFFIMKKKVKYVNK